MGALDVAWRNAGGVGPQEDDALEVVLKVLGRAMAAEIGAALELTATLDELRVEALDRGQFLKQHARPSGTLRVALVAPGVAPLEFLVLLSERDLMLACHALPARPSGAGPDTPAALGGAILEAVAFGMKRGLEERLGLSWHVHSQERDDSRLPDAALVGSMANSAPCVFRLGDARLEMRVMLPESTATRLVLLDQEIPVVQRPRLAECRTTLPEPGALDGDLLGEIPVVVEAVLDAAPMTVGELARLREGASMGLGSPWNHGVRLVIGGQVLARGELVMVGDRRGVLLRAIGDVPG